MKATPAKSAPTTLAGNGGDESRGHHTALLIDAKAAARILSLSARTLWSLTACRAIPSHRIGRLVRYDIAEVRAWVRADCPTDPGSANLVRASMRKGVSL